MSTPHTGRLALSALLLGASAAAGGCSEDTILTVEPVLSMDATEIEFGQVQLGTEATQVFLLRNEGEALLTIERLSEGQPWDEAFTYDLDRTQIPAGSVGQITVRFRPEALGENVAQLVLRAEHEADDRTIRITGAGVTTTLVVNPEEISFGNVVLDSTEQETITVSNNSDVDATIELIEGNNVRRCTSGGATREVFCVLLRDRNLAPDGSFSLRAGETTTLEVQFTPVIAGPTERGDLTLRACASTACDVEIRLDGVGIEQGFRCDPASLDFGPVNPGSCLSRNVTCENIANETVTVVGWGPSTGAGQATSEDFTFEPGAITVLEEGDSLDVDVTYCPADLGNDEGFLQLETDQANPNRFVQVALAGSGGGPDIEVTPLQVNFGLVSLIAPARRSVLVTNVGFDDLELRNLTADTAGTGAFTASLPADVTIAPQGSAIITVEFEPSAEGPVESTLLIESNDSDEREVEVRLVGEGIDLPPCSFEVAPAALSFGAVQVQRTQRRAVEIRNVGSNDCLVTGAGPQAGTADAFSFPDGAVQSQIIAPSSSFTIPVDFTPDAVGAFTGALEFSISSRDATYNTVPLSGTGVESSLLIVPNEIDFGTIGVGCATRARTVQIYNTGNATARIDRIGQAAPANAAFSVTALPTLPVDIPSGQSVEFGIAFRADAVAEYASAVEIEGTFESQAVTYVVSVEGSGALDATQEDRFEQLGTPKVDILFVIDFSGSMNQEQTAMAANFQAFIQFAQQQGLDYHIGVISTGTEQEQGRLFHTDRARGNGFGGPFSNRIVTPATQPSPEEVFGQNVQAIELYGGSPQDESGFYAAYQALTPPQLNGHNAGFLRNDAVLSLIFVSDEPEQSSTSFGAPANDVDFYVNFFLSIKGFRNTNLFTASAIVGDSPGGCDGGGGDADPAPRYIAAAERTGGVFQSICTGDWSRSLEDLSTIAFGFKSRFFLTNQPVISTLTVIIDGVDVPATGTTGVVNWTYDFNSNSVNFSPFSTPEPGAEILVRYTAECL